MAQNNSGVVDYEVTMQRRGPAQGNNADDDGGSNVFTMNRTFTFTADAGKMASPAVSGRRGGNNQARRGGRGFAGRGGGEYVNLAGKKYIRSFKRPNNDTTFYMAQDFLPAENFQHSDKTKKIAGYTCQKATAQLRNATYTIWYTKDIPVSYSPVNGLIPPDGGFVLGLQSDRMEYKATKVQLKAVPESAVQIPAPSHELSEGEVKAMRTQMTERMRRGGQGRGQRQQ
jgi:GLPGLI family protein